MDPTSIAYFDPQSDGYIQNKQFFFSFLESPDYDHATQIRLLLKDMRSRYMVNINDLRKYNAEETAKLLLRPIEYIGPFEAALKEYIQALPDTANYPLTAATQFNVGFTGEFGSATVTPRQLSALHLGRLVCVEGIATRCSSVRPKVIQTVHYCEVTNRHTRVSYHDQTSLTGLATSSAYPTKDAEGNPLVTEYGLSIYHDNQTLAVQEMPEKAPTGLLPCSVDVVLNRDLCDQCKPGDRVQIVGVFKAMPKVQGMETDGLFKSILIASSVTPLVEKARAATALTNDDMLNIRNLAAREDVFQVLAQSIAPSIYGHENIKKALLLMLLGGVERNLANGTHIRGDINVLMVGDPSTAKSQLLRYVLNIAPLAINTTGRGSSGVGLTAAVTSDRETGERRLEAGAMVLADRGVVCIDEFDKMSDADRVAIHEVMEQQTVTVAKAGIHMSLNARCSVVAAANPVYGQYDVNLKPHLNVGLQDSLLSRFDLLFIVLDIPDAALDREIASRVLSNHRFLAADDERDHEELDKDELKTSAVFEKFDRFAHGNQKDTTRELVTVGFLKKYIQYAKERCEPTLTEESSDFIGKKFAELRNSQESAAQDRSLPITARALETLIRLSSAHAKCRLSKEVEKIDCEVAYALMSESLAAAVSPLQAKASRAKPARGDGDSDEDDDSDQADDNDDDGGDSDGDDGDYDESMADKEPVDSIPGTRRSTRSRTRTQSQDDAMQDGDDAYDDEDDQKKKRKRAAAQAQRTKKINQGRENVRAATTTYSKMSMAANAEHILPETYDRGDESASTTQAEDVNLDDKRVKFVQSTIMRTKRAMPENSNPRINDIYEKCNVNPPDRPYSREEFNAILNYLDSINSLMILQDGTLVTMNN